jgi:VWFA-related protein
MRSLFRNVAGGCIVATVTYLAAGGAPGGVRAPIVGALRPLLAQAPQQTGRDGGQAQPRDQQAPADPAQTPTPVFRTGINFVRVDVIVSDKSGGPVADLKQSDFEVTEDGKPQTIEAFRLVKLDGGTRPTPDGPPRQIRTDEDEQAEAAKDDVRLFGIFLDDYHVKLGSSVTVREPLTRFIENQLGPSDMVGVMHPLTPLDSIRMTRNHTTISKAVQQFQGRKGDYRPDNDFEQRYVNYPAETVEQIRNQVSLGAIKAFIVHMGGLKEGRKALILVSEGYSNILPQQLRDPVASLPGFGNPQRGNSSAGQNDPNEDRYAFFSSQDLEFYLQGVYEVASQNNVAIYAVDPRGLAPFEFDIDKAVGPTTDAKFLGASLDTLRALALETDGRAILNRNDLDVGMKQIMRDSSAYYLIGYTSTQAKSDGKFHPISVRVKRPGVQVRARKGYWAYTADDVARATAPKKPGAPPAVEAALAAAVQPSRARVVRTWIGTSRGENGKTKVTFVWEPVPKAPGERASANTEQPARVLVTAVAPDGSPYFRGRVPDAASEPPTTPASGAGAAPVVVGSRVSFEVKPGKMQLRLSVEGSGSQVLDSELREIAIPDLTSAQVLLGTPEVFRARTVRDFQLLKADPAAVPVALREFSRTERVLVRVAAYGPASSSPMIKVRLLNRAGQPMSDLTVTPGSGPGSPSQIEVPLTGLAVGDYVIEITAGGDGGEAKELVGFHLTA